MAQDDYVDIDLRDYREQVSSRIEPGTYTLQITHAEVDKSRKGDKMINVWLAVVGGGEFDGATIIERLTQVPQAMFRTVGLLQGLGLPTPRKQLRMRPSQWVGKVVTAEVDDGSPYQGRVSSQVTNYVRPGNKNTAAAADVPAQDDLEFAEFEKAQAPEPDPEPASLNGSAAPQVESEESTQEEKPARRKPLEVAAEPPEEVDLEDLDIS